MRGVGWLKSAGSRPSERPVRESGEVRLIPVEAIQQGRHQFRTAFSEAELEKLAASIAEHGLIHPILVRPCGAGYELIAGERRWRAFRLLGREAIPAIVRTYSDEEAALAGLIENLQRDGLQPIDEATAYLELMTRFGLKQEEVARRVGLSQPAVANKLRLLKLPEAIRADISRGILSERHARALLRLPTVDQQLRAAEAVIRRELTVRDTERLVSSMLGETAEGSGATSGGGRSNGENSAAGRLRPDGREALPRGGSSLGAIGADPVQGAGGDAGRARRFVGVIKDVRVVLNELRRLYTWLREGGVAVEMEEARTEGMVKVTLAIPLGPVTAQAQRRQTGKGSAAGRGRGARA